MSLYYVIASYEQDGKRVFQNLIWETREDFTKFYALFKKKIPGANPRVHKVWDIESEGREFLRLWDKANDLASKFVSGALKRLPDKLK